MINEPAMIYRNERYNGISFLAVDSFIAELSFNVAV